MTWSLYSEEKSLEPLKFSNGKTQEDVVKEVLKAIDEGEKVIFIHGICGTGKSAIALNIAKELGKTSIVVPIKNLQMQYKQDYEKDKYVLKKNKEKLKISVITGRKNHECEFLKGKKDNITKVKEEVNSKLQDIFSGVKKDFKIKRGKDVSADNKDLPCKIDIKEGNWRKIKAYLEKNKDVSLKNFGEISDVKRVSVAGACKYWCPVLNEKYELRGPSFVNAVKRSYEAIGGKFVFYQRAGGCKFYEQFNSFIDSDVIVFNSMKYQLESLLGRKPVTEVEIIDECDEFLDKLANQRRINLDRLQNSLIRLISLNENAERASREISELVKHLRKNKKLVDAVGTKEIIPLKETGIYDVLKVFLRYPEILHDADEESYLFKVMETAKIFEDFMEETYVTIDKDEGGFVCSLVTTNLAKKFKCILDDNKIIVLMSGTLHSEEVLKNIFGLESFKIIEAEIESQGRIEIKTTGLEKNCKYSNFSNGEFNREDYLKSLDKCVEVSKKPVLVHVQAFIDLPLEEEIKKFGLKNLLSNEKLRQNQIEDKTGKLVENFKKGMTKIFFSTRSGRGIDFPGEQCNSIVFTKYPNPNVQDAFWKILHKTKPLHYWDFYKDKAKRELWQKIYRGLRFKEDHIYLLSPDCRVLEAVEN